MQNGIHKEGWLELSNRFSMNLTKVLFVAFIFLLTLSFAAATKATELVEAKAVNLRVAEAEVYSFSIS